MASKPEAVRQTAEQIRRCIELCQNCHTVCLRTLAYCLRMGGQHAAEQHLRVMTDCAEICQTSADFMLRGSDFHARVCGEVCVRCAESCEAFGDDDRMKACAETCRECAESCRTMADTAAA